MSTSPSDEPHVSTAKSPTSLSGVIDPPRGFFRTLGKIGPGLVIAGSIVGSGELIATTKTGAQAGMSLLWLILIGCVIKVFAQIELGRHAITHGQTTLSALNSIPGRIGRANWILWFWLVMMAASIAQLGGIVGGVGQALALSFPIQGDYVSAIETPSASQLNQYLEWDDALLSAYDLQLYLKAEQDALVATLNAERLLLRNSLENHSFDSSLSGSQDSTVAAPSDDAEQWVASRNLQTAKWVQDLPESQLGPLGDAYRAAFPDGSSLSASELESRRAALRQLLNTINVEPLQKEVARRVANGSLKELPTAESLQRISRGHAVLAETFVVVDQTSASRPGRPSMQTTLLSQIELREAQAMLNQSQAEGASTTAAEAESLQQSVVLAKKRVTELTEPWTWDDKYWAAFITAITIALLVNGSYGIIEVLSTALVVAFTLITVGNVIGLQTTTQWHISSEMILKGLSFGLPETGNGIKMALATFGIIGVGATELITYPYWCIEKGYARNVGPRTDDESWAMRARGWMRVMHYDAFCSMVIYTIATVAFFMMGAAVLHNDGRDPDGMRMVSTLATAYVPVFGEYAKILFLVGAFAVLYSTFLVANAGHSRMITDGIKVFGLIDPGNEKAHHRSIAVLCVLLPSICLAIFCTGINPVTAVAFAGVMQATMLPMIGFAALYLRRTASDPRISPPLWWDLLLFLSFIGLLVVGLYGLWSVLIG